MEQKNQQETQKPSFPIKTKIAAWWMIIVGIIGIIAFFVLFEINRVMFATSECKVGYGLIVVPTLPAFPLFLSGVFLLAKRKWTWWVSAIFLSVGLAVSILLIFVSLIFSPIILIVLLPLILFLFDRKNFWKIAT